MSKISLQPFASRFAEWVVAKRTLVIALSLILVGFAAYGSVNLTLSTSYRIFFNQNNPELLALEALERTYGKSDSVIFIVAPENNDAFSEQALAATLWLTEQAWRTPYSTRVDSLTNFQHTTADGDMLFVDNLVNAEILSSIEKRSEVRDIALSDPRLVGKLLARDASVSTVIVTIALPQDKPAVGISEITKFSRDLVNESANAFPDIDVRLVGSIIINHAFAEAAVNSQKIFLPLSLAVMAVFLLIFTRMIAGVVAIGITMIFSVAVSMGLGGWIGLPFSPPVAPAPTIVLMIVVANCVHLLVTFQQRLWAGDSKHNAIVESIRVNLHPVFLASFTTALGFLAMNFAEVPPHRHLGTFVAFGILASFFLSVTLLPALLSLLPVRAPNKAAQSEQLMSKLSRFVLRRQRLLLYGSIATAVIFAALIPRNELNDVLTQFFDQSVEFRQDLDFLDERMGGNTVLEYSLISSGNIAAPEFLADISAFAEWYREQPPVQNVAIISDTFRYINKSLHGDAPEAYRLPQTDELAIQFLLLYELSLPFGLDLNNQISFDKSSTRMTVTATTLSSNEVLELNRRAEQWLADNTSHIVSATGSGPALLFAYIGQRNIRSMLLGTAIVLLCISIVLLFAFRSVRLGLISLVPNFFPAIFGFGVWGLTVGEVGTSLSVVVAMTIGIVVDDTVHFLSKYRRGRLEYGYTPDEAVNFAFQSTGQAIFATTVVLVTGFLVLMLSPFVPTAQVGLLTALIIGFALICDFFMLAPILIAVDRKSQRVSKLTQSA